MLESNGIPSRTGGGSLGNPFVPIVEWSRRPRRPPSRRHWKQAYTPNEPRSRFRLSARTHLAGILLRIVERAIESPRPFFESVGNAHRQLQHIRMIMFLCRRPIRFTRRNHAKSITRPTNGEFMNREKAFDKPRGNSLKALCSETLQRVEVRALPTLASRLGGRPAIQEECGEHPWALRPPRPPNVVYPTRLNTVSTASSSPDRACLRTPRAHLPILAKNCSTVSLASR